MKKSYETPQMTAYGSVDRLTGVFGNPSTGDVQFDLSGDVVESGSQSVDSCPTENQETCDFRDRP